MMNCASSIFRPSAVGAAVEVSAGASSGGHPGPGGRAGDGVAAGRGVAVHRLPHGADVLGRGPAAPADPAGACPDHAGGVLGHVRRRREVDEPLADAAGQAGVRLDDQGQAPGLDHELSQDVVQHARAHRAVGPRRLDRELAKGPHHLGRGASEKGDAVLGEGERGHHRQVTRRADRLDGQAHLDEVGHGLHHEAVHAALEQALGLLAEGGARLVRLDRAEGGQVLAEGADRTEHEHVAPHALADVAGQLHAEQVDLAHLPVQSVNPELEAVRPEGVGLHEVGAGLDVLGVDALDELGTVQVEDVEARVEGDSARVEHGAHGAVAEERPLGEPGQERRGHPRLPPTGPAPPAGRRARGPPPGRGRPPWCPR